LDKIPTIIPFGLAALIFSVPCSTSRAPRSSCYYYVGALLYLCTISYLLAVSHKQRPRLYLPFGILLYILPYGQHDCTGICSISKSLLYPLVFRNTYYALLYCTLYYIYCTLLRS
jgi:hypothetical protein